jgi:2,4-dienoyl-CoA reductase-like NADH-dependent reductase (Old Yellow Enzyme family)
MHSPAASQPAPEAPLLFTPMRIRGTTLPNRMMLAPLCQYSAKDGLAGDWHLVHLGKFALGGMGIVMTEAAAVEPRGRITWGDLGLWDDSHIPGLRRITDFIREQGALPAIQLAHAGRKAGTQRPWEGNGPLSAKEIARGEIPLPAVGPTGEAVDKGFTEPQALDEKEIRSIVQRFGEAAARADAAGFDIIEIHGAHGYLIASFLSPVTNTRNDGYGGDRAGRMRFACEVARAIREKWPAHKPLICRISAVDGAPDGWSVDDSVVLAGALRECGVDVIDCSSGGLRGSSTLSNTVRGPGYQVHLASEIRERSGVMTAAVGLILDGLQAEAILRNGNADIVVVGRQAMYDPYWAHHARQQLAADPRFTGWNEQSGWWLRRRADGLAQIGLRPDGLPAETSL